MPNIRTPAVAGTFYPASPSALREEIEKLFEESATFKFSLYVKGVISPHAGYTFSGKVAATAYKALKGRRGCTVVLVGPSHYTGFLGVSVYSYGFWETPLGKVRVDEELAQEILRESRIFLDKPGLQESEHSLEVQIPFLQVMLEDFRILPLMVGELREASLTDAGQALHRATQGRDVIFVASTDLYHGYSYRECVETDKRTLETIKRGDALELFNALKRGEAQACGGYAVCLVLEALRSEGIEAELLSYTNSADVTGSYSGYVVGYSAFALLSHKDAELPNFTEEEKKEILNIAKESVINHLKGISYVPEEPDLATLKIRTGVFVTLKQGNTLRGCVGFIKGIKPLFLLVADAARAAAFDDPRFPPVSLEEVHDLSFEISILSSPRPIESPADIKLGTHGLIVKKGPYQGLLLPQVATENDWDLKTFLEHTCLKAGLPPDCWKEPDTTIFVFSAQIFGDEEKG